MIRKLQWKFVAVTMLIVTLILSAMFCFFYLNTRNTAQMESMEALKQAARNPERPPLPWLREEGRVNLPTFTIETDAAGEVKKVWGSIYEENSAALQAIADAVLEQPEDAGLVPGLSLRFFRLQLSGGGWRIGCADRSFETQMLQGLLRSILLVGLGALALFFVISLLLARWMTQPVEQAWNRQRQFVADASHELKTPLTVILSNADMLAAHCGARDSSFRRWTDNIRAEAGQMRQLVEELLQLARSSGEPSPAASGPADLSDLAENSALTFEPIVYEQGLRLETSIASNCRVRGQEAQLRQLVELLLDNAVKYSLPGGLIRLELRPEGGKTVLLRVSNPSELIPGEELERLFDRFYRRDPSRGSCEGYGLGLSIARRLAAASQGKIWAEHQNGVTQVLVRLPMVP
ncbi:MAG: HAMP domain-containing histidine kinase [Oscillospiraceae bacterium]|nr:HAMP domain-containing histidine kinase [Oscillospiraceae bacterium]